MFEKIFGRFNTINQRKIEDLLQNQTKAAEN